MEGIENLETPTMHFLRIFKTLKASITKVCKFSSLVDSHLKLLCFSAFEKMTAVHQELGIVDISHVMCHFTLLGTQKISIFSRPKREA